ncbi:DeoR/GlpR family DNA-binding transcription regulator [Stappia sp.]|uniref:DeoR/GlpR family DNA-binding transcription regulator n=1 Tax=Stappia sp. TaxID=1870903 RepID=UPI003452FB30|tara:strand:- start:2493 stop:3308 length:816 start_codon:yes stop_codon:yes gene_type:complete
MKMKTGLFEMDTQRKYKTEGNKKESRKSFIEKYIEENGFISVDEITKLFSVTTQTARRDIMALEALGKVRRLHGGAALVTPVTPLTLRERRLQQAPQKLRIAASIANLVPDGAAIFIDTGTTCEAVAQALLARRDLRVVTYSLRVASILSENSDFALAIPGGFVRPVDGGLFQENTDEFIRQFRFDHAVVSVSGIDAEGNLYDDDQAEVAAVAAALGQADRRILAVDSSKFGKRALVRLGSLEMVTTLVTDERPDEALCQRAKAASVDILV